MIDFFVSRNISSSFMGVNEEFDPDSDHSPIVLTFSDTMTEKEQNPTLSKKTDWDTFREKLKTESV